jgi:hypothetical protein
VFKRVAGGGAPGSQAPGPDTLPGASPSPGASSTP